MDIDAILKEDSARMARIHSPYDPTKGSEPVKIDLERCRHDFEYWAATCCYIKNKAGGEDILFKLNPPQRKMVAALEKMRRESLPIRLILLKARQWGGSTCVQLYMAWLQMMHKTGLNSLIIAHQHTATAEIKEMFMRMIENYPEKVMEATGTLNDGEVKEEKEGNGKRSRNKSVRKRTESKGPGTLGVPSHNFKVKVASAERPDACRGGDYSLIHCSEVALWKKTRLKMPEDMIRAATSGVLLAPMTLIVLESTANGTGNYFHTEYEAAKRGESQFVPLFVAWYEIEQYSLPLSPEQKREFASRLIAGRNNRQALNDRSQSGAYLWWLWEKGATLEAINWYVKERAKYADHAHMASEYPSDDVEAFVYSGTRVFDRYRVEELRKGCSLSFKRGEVTGLFATGPDSIKNVKFSEDNQGALKIWKMPEVYPDFNVSNRYLTVVDIGGRSLQADWSVILVIDREPMARGEGPEVVAQWRGHTDFDLLAWNAARISAFYDNALLVVESNTLETHDSDRNVEGNQSNFILHQLRMAYPNLYSRKRNPEDIRQGKPLKYGFHTNVATKPLIIANLIQVVREGLYVEREPLCLDEYLCYEQRQDGSYGAISGKHDDILMTRAIGLHICFNEMPLPRKIMKAPVDSYPGRWGGYASF